MMKRDPVDVLRRLLVLPVMLSIVGSFATAGLATANSFPGWANSHYMSPLTSSAAYGYGCDLAGGTYQQGTTQDLVVILDFGYPSTSGSTYGAGLWSGGGHQFESDAYIADKVEQFGFGWYNCSGTTEQLKIVVGVMTDSSTTVTAAAGTHWGDMVDSINAWMSTSPHTIVSQVYAYGGIDIESGFAATASQITAWVNAFSTASSATFTYDFGDAAGCPYASYTSPPGYACNRGWTQDNYFYWSWGCSACEGMPEIYNTTTVTLPNGNTSDHNAQQWEGIRRYGYNEKGSTNVFVASTTQRTACGQPGHSCSGTNNTALTGWTHLHNSLGAYAPTTSVLYGSTDFMWGW